MIKYILTGSRQSLMKTFEGMSPMSRSIHHDITLRLANNGKVSVSKSDILGHEYMIFLEKRSIVKRN